MPELFFERKICIFFVFSLIFFHRVCEFKCVLIFKCLEGFMKVRENVLMHNAEPLNAFLESTGSLYFESFKYLSAHNSSFNSRLLH